MSKAQHSKAQYMPAMMMQISDRKTHVGKLFLSDEELKLIETKEGKEKGVLRFQPIGSNLPSYLIKLGGYHYATLQEVKF